MFIKSKDILKLHDRYLGLDSWPHNYVTHKTTLINSLIIKNHLYNSLLWNEEDLARRRHADNSEIARNKRNIDGYNQKRNDCIEKIDEHIISTMDRQPSEDTPLNSETAGAIIDRLSILSLKIHNMKVQTERDDVNMRHIDQCNNKLNTLISQRNDLGKGLDNLLHEFVQGTRYFKIYRQYKMYNNPDLNPEIYNEKK